MARRKVAFDENNERQREGGAGQIVFRVVGVQDQPDELHREADPEEEVELDEAEEDLVMGEHGLDPAVRTEELVDLPSKLGVDLPAERNVRDLGDGDDNGDDDGEGLD